MLANPQYFSSMKWKEQRDILMRLVTDVSDVELAQTDAKYAQLLGELEKAPSTDDIRAKFQKALTEWKRNSQRFRYVLMKPRNPRLMLTWQSRNLQR